MSFARPIFELGIYKLGDIRIIKDLQLESYTLIREINIKI